MGCAPACGGQNGDRVPWLQSTIAFRRDRLTFVMVNVVSADLYISACDSVHSARRGHRIRAGVSRAGGYCYGPPLAPHPQLADRWYPGARLRVERTDRLPIARGGRVAVRQGFRAGLRVESGHVHAAYD